MTHARLRQPQVVLIILALILTALFGTNLPAKAQSAWTPGVAYSVGVQVTYNGRLYQCAQAHTSQVGWEPPNVPALWSDRGPVGSNPTATNTSAPPTATRTRTNTVGGPTATRTRTNTAGGPTATRTRTNTVGGSTATTTRTSTSAPSGNLALNKPATSSSNETASMTPNLAVDGNAGTRWASLYSDPQWIRIDLLATYSINRVVLRWEAAYARSYQVQLSNDGATWSTIYSTTAGDGGVDDLTGLSGSGRYLRVNGTVRATAWGYSLWEIEAYAGSGPTPTRTNTSVGPTPTRTNTSVGPTPTRTRTNTSGPALTMGNIIPMPVSMSSSGGSFTLTSNSDIYVEPASTELIGIGNYLAGRLNPSTGYGMQVLSTSGAPAAGNIYLTTAGGDPALGNEGYELSVTSGGVTLRAYRPEGLFRGIQTIRQLLPAAIEQRSLQAGPWVMATGTIRDYPRFAWRGAMLDVARHFFSVADVKAYIDQLAYYKINRFHMHLTDDQGWRIEIKSWPRLATYGGSTQVGGGAGGYYTQVQYQDLVAYAQARYITLIPEIDMPGHTNAALASYAELNCNNTAPALYTGTGVGFSSLCINKEITYTFIGDVIRELAAITPGQYIHIGGDEASATTQSDYVYFIGRVQTIVQSNGKQMLGWEEIAQASLNSTTVGAQHWNSTSYPGTAVQKGAKIIMSPATKAYLDMKYNSSTPLGLSWAGYTDVQDGYSWDPGTQVGGVSASNVLGMEAPLWTETIDTLDEVEYMAFPRLPGHAEVSWSQTSGRSWSEYSQRLGWHGPRMSALGINFFRSGQVTWR